MADGVDDIEEEMMDEPAEELTPILSSDQTEQIVEEMKCWELRSNCMMKNQARENAGCPAYRQGLGCWEVDWKAIVEALPASQREYWLSFLDHCDKCVAYKAHPSEMQARIDAVKAVMFDD